MASVDCLPIDIAVLGSCVTRDVFNRSFCPSYKEFFNCGISQIQGSLLSVLSLPFSVPEDQLAEMKLSSANDIRSEMSREFRVQIVEQKPEYILVDLFGDVRFGAARLKSGAIVTRNEWKLCRTQFYADSVIEEYLPRTDEYFDMWLQSARQLKSYIRAVSPKSRIILHDAEFVTKYRTNDGEVKNMSNSAQLEVLNRWWRRLNTRFADEFADGVIKVRSDSTMSFEDHPWGVYGVHYELSYHADFLNALIRGALIDARGGSLIEWR